MTSFAHEQKPNIIMIAVDDLNDWVGVYGNTQNMLEPLIPVAFS